MVFTTNLRTFPSRFLFIKIQKRFSRINLKFFRKGYTTTQLRSGFHLKRRLYLIGLSTYFILIVTRIVRRYEYSSQTTNLVPIKRLINKHIELIIMFSLDIEDCAVSAFCDLRIFEMSWQNCAIKTDASVLLKVKICQVRRKLHLIY